MAKPPHAASKAHEKGQHTSAALSIFYAGQTIWLTAGSIKLEGLFLQALLMWLED